MGVFTSFAKSAALSIFNGAKDRLDATDPEKFKDTVIDWVTKIPAKRLHSIAKKAFDVVDQAIKKD